MTVTVAVGFLYILNVCLLFVFVIVRIRKFILLLTSISKVKFNFRCTSYWCCCLVCLLLPLYRSNISEPKYYFISIFNVLFVEYVGLFDIVEEYFSKDAGNQ